MVEVRAKQPFWPPSRWLEDNNIGINDIFNADDDDDDGNDYPLVIVDICPQTIKSLEPGSSVF